jgi:hypothetical protein
MARVTGEHGAIAMRESKRRDHSIGPGVEHCRFEANHQRGARGGRRRSGRRSEERRNVSLLDELETSATTRIAADPPATNVAVTSRLRTAPCRA